MAFPLLPFLFAAGATLVVTSSKGKMTPTAVAAAIYNAYKGRGEMSRLLANDIVVVALRVKADPFALANLINFESGFKSKIENGWCVRVKGGDQGLCGVGLIQFMPRTCVRLFGMKDTPANRVIAAKRMRALSAHEQMPWVQLYLERASGGRSLKNPASLYMAVFYPAYIGKPDKLFPPKVVEQNGGMTKPRDYIAKVGKNALLPTTTA